MINTEEKANVVAAAWGTDKLLYFAPGFEEKVE